MIATELSADVRAVADMLAAAPVGEVVTFGAMSAAIGRSITTCRHVLASARNVALRENGAAFLSERSIGLRRMSAERATETVGSTARAHIRSTARRAKRTLIGATNGVNDLPPEAQRRMAAEVSALALVEHLARDAAVKPGAEAPTKPTPVAVTARSMMAALVGAP